MRALLCQQVHAEAERCHLAQQGIRSALCIIEALEKDCLILSGCVIFLLVLCMFTSSRQINHIALPALNDLITLMNEQLVLWGLCDLAVGRVYVC